MYWTRNEKNKFWQRNQVDFAEKAHEYPCCDIPTISKCLLCDINQEECENKAEIGMVIAEWKGGSDENAN